MMAEHIEIGRRYPEITINTAYSFGLDDQEFVVSFECDDPGEFLDLVQELRGSESSAYTLRDIPIFTCVAMSTARALDALDGTAASAALAAGLSRPDPLPFRAPLAPLGTPETPLRVAIVGSGPAGFYAAEHLLKPDDLTVEVDMFDRLPTPFGLVRAGVAPDHPKIKSVIRVYEKTAARDGFRFFGNVEVGRDLTVAELERALQRGRLRLRHGDRPPARDPGRGPARLARGDRVRQLVQRPPRLRRRRASTSPPERAVVIGNGNVAADVARMLALPRAELETTDTADHAIEALAELGDRGDRRARPPRARRRRRSPTPRCASSASSPTPTSSSTRPRSSSTSASREYVESEDCDPTHRRNVEIFTEFSEREPEGKPKRVVMRFCCSPVEIKGDGRVESVVVGRNELYRDESGAIRARDTGEREEIECGLVLRSIGYKGVGLEGIPFDSGRGLIPNEAGRVDRARVGRAGPGPLRGRLDQARPVGRDRDEQEGRPGDRRRDPSRTSTAGPGARTRSRRTRPAFEELLAERAGDHVTYLGWQAIDRAEVAAGEPHGRPRIKFCRVARDGRGARGPTNAVAG